jgi:alpha-glucosidase
LAVDRQEEDSNSVLNLTRRLVAVRKTCPALRTGTIRRVEAPAPLLVCERGEGAEALLCAFNLGDEAAEWALPAGWRILERVGEPMAPLSGLIAERAR